MFRTRLLLLLLAFLPAASLTAQLRIGLELKDKSRLEAEVLGIEGDKVSLKTYFEGGSAEVTRKLDDFTPKSQHSIRFHSLGDEDYVGFVDLSERAAANGMYEESRQAMRRARAIVRNLQPDPQTLKPVIDRAVAITERVLSGLAKKGSVREVKYILNQIAQSDERYITPEMKQHFVEIVDREIAAAEASAETQRAAKEDAAATEKRKKAFEPYVTLVHKGRAEHNKGLLAGRSFGTASQHFKNAEREFDRALQGADEIEKKYASDQIAQNHVKELRLAAEDGKIASVLALSSLELVRGKYNHAMAGVNRILAIDPENKQALDMRARIEVAANSDDWALGPRY